VPRSSSPAITSVGARWRAALACISSTRSRSSLDLPDFAAFHMLADRSADVEVGLVVVGERRAPISVSSSGNAAKSVRSMP
jgi:hypothetical protein